MLQDQFSGNVQEMTSSLDEAQTQVLFSVSLPSDCLEQELMENTGSSIKLPESVISPLLT